MFLLFSGVWFGKARSGSNHCGIRTSFKKGLLRFTGRCEIFVGIRRVNTKVSISISSIYKARFFRWCYEIMMKRFFFAAYYCFFGASIYCPRARTTQMWSLVTQRMSLKFDCKDFFLRSLKSTWHFLKESQRRSIRYFYTPNARRWLGRRCLDACWVFF